jgi:hypothetical protein
VIAVIAAILLANAADEVIYFLVGLATLFGLAVVCIPIATILVGVVIVPICVAISRSMQRSRPAADYQRR